MLDAVCLGESMVVGSVVPPLRLRDADSVALECAGAESNVAIALAALGHDVAWVGRLGGDPFGGRIIDTLRRANVDVRGVEYDSSAPTGMYFKDPTRDGTRVHYYRSQSAASTMSPRFLTRLPSTRLVHLSGVTAALSPSCADMMTAAIVDRAVGADAVVSFDVNQRSALWPAERAGPVLKALADAADIVFVGLDEANKLWGLDTAEAVRALLPHPTALIVKNADVGATLFLRHDAPRFVPALDVDVVEPVGAGDAFASGVLSAVLAEAPASAWLQMGHYMASLALSRTGDIVTDPDLGHVRAIMSAPSSTDQRATDSV
ncbi:sugar kinase [Haloglycomyces albus]|uniref:sugar kinase n=1 Tax=Haloglycomyces albus TaxID=526067 RepID=UPI00046D32F4|nr:sugar kinase [Haloglycomyces albus]